MKKFISWILVAACLLLSAVSAFALEDDSSVFEDILEPNLDTVSFSDSRFDGKDWSAIVSDFLDQSQLEKNSVAIGYKNIVTGEEHYLSGDTYMQAGQLLNIPLTMLLLDQTDEAAFDDNLTDESSLSTDSNDSMFSIASVSDILDGSLTYSSNLWTEKLWDLFDSETEAKTRILTYMDDTEKTVIQGYWSKRILSSKQVIDILSFLYDSEQYSGILDRMLKSEPCNGFLYDSKELSVAHKCGFFKDSQKGNTYSDAAVLYTYEPVLLVMFVQGNDAAPQILSDFCTLMCDYSQYSYKNRYGMDPDDLDEDADSSAALPEESGTRITDSASDEDSLHVVDSSGTENVGKPSFFSTIIDAILNFFSDGEIRYGDPQAVVTDFFDAVTLHDYSAAYACLYNCSTLGLENISGSTNDAVLVQCVFDNFKWSLAGALESKDTGATQLVKITTFSLNAAQDEINRSCSQLTKEYVSSLPGNEIYGEDGTYLKSFKDMVYGEAVSEVVDHYEDYVESYNVHVDLIYTSGHWKIKVTSELLNALCGYSA